MNEIQIFKNPQFGEIRTIITENGDPMFCLADLCKALELTNPRSVKSRLDSLDVQLIDLHAVNPNDTIVGNSMANFVTEAAFYEVVLQSSSSKVKPFKKWVTSEVLPSIRKHGVYATPQTIESMLADPENAIKVFQALKEEREARRIAETKIAEDAPKVLFAETIVGSKSTCLIGELAKIISQNGHPIGQNRLFKWLRENGYLGKRGERYNIPNQQYVEMGLFELKKGVRSGDDGVLKVTVTTKVTGRGQQYFINKFLARCNGNIKR